MDVTISEAERYLTLGVEEYDSDSIERLESFIIDCNNAANDFENRDVLVEDAIYDRLIEILKQVKPESSLFNELWTAEGDITDHTELLQSNPMMSIQTVKSWGDDEFTDFVERVEELSDDRGSSLILSYKLNGHGIRVVYVDGELVSATSRARSSAGNDLTRQLKVVLGERNEALADMGMVEIRGELVLHADNLEAAREFNPGIKSLFSGVSSLVRRYSTAEENQLLDFLAYRIIDDRIAPYMMKDEEYAKLESWGFKVPEYATLEVSEGDDIAEEIQGAFSSFEDDYEAYGYFCDGIVVEVNSREEFHSLGTAGVRAYGNIALKVGTWAQDMYTGVVQYIEWTPGKNKLSPVAIVAAEEGIAEFNSDNECTNFDKLGVMTNQGNTVRRVPLYEPRNIWILNAYPGHPLNLRYGGEAGVVPCNAKGELLKDDALRARIVG